MDAGTRPPTQGSMTVEKINHVIEGADLRAESAVRSRFEGFRAYPQGAGGLSEYFEGYP